MKFKCLSIIILLIFFSSCSRIVDLELEEWEIKGVSISSFFKNNDSLKVFILKMPEKDRYYRVLGGTPQIDYLLPEVYVTNAQVFISDDSNNTVELQKNDKFFYLLQENFLKENKNYYLKVIHNTSTFSAHSKIPNKVLVNINSVSNIFYYNGQDCRNISFTIVDNKNENNYFLLFAKTINTKSEIEDAGIFKTTPNLSDFNYNFQFFTDETFKNSNLKIDALTTTDNSDFDSSVYTVGYIIEVLNLSEEF